jgi:hypothetical protein
MDKKHKQWEGQCVAFHDRILDRLKQDKHIEISQYKSLYFSIFEEAYVAGFCAPLSYRRIHEQEGARQEWICTRPLVSGTSIWEHALRQGWCHPDTQGNEQRYKQIQTVMIWWDEWTYAWHNLGHKTRCHETVEKRL